jgi:transposase-like protein
MARIARKSDGRRIFTDEFKRKQIERVLRGELTLADLSRKLGIARSLLQRWKRAMSQGGDNPRATRMTVIPPIELRDGHYIRELELLVGKQTVELEKLRAALDALRKGSRSRSR